LQPRLHTYRGDSALRPSIEVTVERATTHRPSLRTTLPV